MESLRLRRISSEVKSEVMLPGSKSISNRTLLLAALAEGKTELIGLLDSDDTDRMKEALQELGVTIEKTGNNSWVVDGVAGKFKKTAKLFLGNAGTAFRPLTAVLALSGGHYELSGVPRMHERPIADLVDALRQAGANIEYLGQEGFPPLKISPGNINVDAPIKIRGDVSSQFLTALLMAFPLTKQKVTIEVIGELISKPYINITLNLMQRFGVTVENDHWRKFTIPANSTYTNPTRLFVEGDASSASYFWAAGAIAGEITVIGVGLKSIQGDIEFVNVLKNLNVGVWEPDINLIKVTKPHEKIKGFDLDCNNFPDAAMTLAILALFAEGKSTLRNIASWRVKETDRLTAMATELRKVGATVEEGVDYITITPPAKLTPNVEINTYDDHRMAMCFSLVSLGNVPIIIKDPKCVAKTFPDYFEKFASITNFPVIAIDGPSASGKGTVAQQVAQHLGFHYLDSGALYRVVALAAKQQGIAWQDEVALAELARQLDIAFVADSVLLNGMDVSGPVRSEEMGRGASEVAVHPAVRLALLGLQHDFRQAPGLVADGRDMATVVFPDAVTKIYLTARVEIRAERRYKQLMSKGIHANLRDILKDLEQRDARDSQRSAAPLQQTATAKLLETSELSIEQSIALALNYCKPALESS